MPPNNGDRTKKSDLFFNIPDTEKLNKSVPLLVITPPPSLRGAKRRGNPDAFIQQRLWPHALLIRRNAALPAASLHSSQLKAFCDDNGAVSAKRLYPRHCEERSDVAIQTHSFNNAFGKCLIDPLVRRASCRAPLAAKGFLR